MPIKKSNTITIEPIEVDEEEPIVVDKEQDDEKLEDPKIEDIKEEIKEEPIEEIKEEAIEETEIVEEKPKKKPPPLEKMSCEECGVEFYRQHRKRHMNSRLHRMIVEKSKEKTNNEEIIPKKKVVKKVEEPEVKPKEESEEEPEEKPKEKPKSNMPLSYINRLERLQQKRQNYRNLWMNSLL